MYNSGTHTRVNYALPGLVQHHQPPRLPPERTHFLPVPVPPVPEPTYEQVKSRTPSSSTRMKRCELWVVPLIVILIALAVIAIIVFVLNVRPDGQAKSADPELEARRDLVRQMAKEAWDAYVQYAWGHDTLLPVTREPSWDLFGKNSGLTIVASLSTLWIMGLKEEYELGREWIRDNLTFGAIKRQVDVQHSVNYYMGGLLSSYALTQDELFLNKSRQVAEALEPAYRTATGLPYWHIKPASGEVSGKTPFLSAVGGQHLEYIYLAHLTGNATYKERAVKIRTHLASIAKPYSGLFMNQVNVERSGFHTTTSTLFQQSRHFFSYLIKSYTQSANQETDALELFQKAMQQVEKHGMIKNSSSPEAGYLYTMNYNQHQKFHRYEKYMNYDGCALGAMFGAAAQIESWLFDKKLRDKYWDWAVGLTDTCFEAANRTATKLSPYRFYFDYKEEEEVNMDQNGRYVLNPELAETYFVLWRLTHDRKYRDAAWQMAQAIHEHCKVDSAGYSKIVDVHTVPTEKANLQDQELLSTTLKYLYLTFTDDNQLPLDQWIFNVRGQPLPVIANNKHSFE